MKDERPSKLDLLVKDSGRTWSVLYDEIDTIPPEAVELGDVFIVRNRAEPGVMFMQAIRPKPNGWVLGAIQFSREHEAT